MTDVKHEAPAEGAGEALKETISRMLWSFMTSSEEVDDLTDIGWTKAKQLIGQGFFTGTSAAYYNRIGRFADTLVATIRARSSAPEARSPELSAAIKRLETSNRRHRCENGHSSAGEDMRLVLSAIKRLTNRDGQ